MFRNGERSFKNQIPSFSVKKIWQYQPPIRQQQSRTELRLPSGELGLGWPVCLQSHPARSVPCLGLWRHLNLPASALCTNYHVWTSQTLRGFWPPVITSFHQPLIEEEKVMLRVPSSSLRFGSKAHMERLEEVNKDRNHQHLPAQGLQSSSTGPSTPGGGILRCVGRISSPSCRWAVRLRYCEEPFGGSWCGNELWKGQLLPRALGGHGELSDGHHGSQILSDLTKSKLLSHVLFKPKQSF